VLLLTAAKVCIAEVEELVGPGELKPDDIHLPGIYVHRIFKVGSSYTALGCHHLLCPFVYEYYAGVRSA
jgi:hypothetical protein